MMKTLRLIASKFDPNQDGPGYRRTTHIARQVICTCLTERSHKKTHAEKLVYTCVYVLQDTLN